MQLLWCKRCSQTAKAQQIWATLPALSSDPTCCLWPVMSMHAKICTLHPACHFLEDQVLEPWSPHHQNHADPTQKTLLASARWIAFTGCNSACRLTAAAWPMKRDGQDTLSTGYHKSDSTEQLIQLDNAMSDVCTPLEAPSNCMKLFYTKPASYWRDGNLASEYNNTNVCSKEPQ